jgi:4-amino-4-deoxy-L-arabinose transferase-like glycosyltransferase
MTTNATTSARGRTPVLLGTLLLAFLLGTGLRPYNVPDEGRYGEVAREMLRSGDLVTPRLDGVPFLDKPPLLYWLEAASFRTFGVHPWSARLVTALLGFLGCALVLAAGTRLYGPRAGALAAIVLAANPLWYGGSQYVNHDVAVATWISAALLCFAVGDREEGRARWRWLMGGYVAMGLALMTKGLIGVVLPLGTLGLWILATRHWQALRRGHLLAGSALTLAIAVPWHAIAQRANPQLLHYLFVVQHFQRFTSGGFNNQIGPLFYPAMLAAGLLPWTPLLPGAIGRAWRAFRADRVAGRTDLLLLVWPLVVVVFFSIPRSKIVGYVLPAVPALALLLGRHLDAVLEERAPLRRPLAVAAALMALLGAAVVGAPLTGRVPGLAGTPAALAVGTGLGLLGAAALVVVARRRGAPRLAIGAMAGFTCLLAAGLLAVAPAVTRDSTLPLVERIRPLLRDGDRVACWGRYFYDLPLYLDRREPVVVATRWDDPEIPRRDTWQRELWLGREWDPRGREWLVSPEELAATCGAGGARCLIVAKGRDLPAVQAAMPLDVVAEANGAVLLASRAVVAGPTAAASGDAGR